MSTTQPSNDFAYDVFVSYRQREPDLSWVRKKLVPRLEAEGLRAFVDYKHFKLGAPLVLEMARGVESCRYTLAVLSPQYLESDFTELENILAEHLGLENSERRLIAVMIQSCKPRLGMRTRLWLSMLSDAEFDANIDTLVNALREPPIK